MKNITTNKKLGTWEITSRVFTVIQFLMILLSAFLIVTQIKEIGLNRSDKYMQYTSKFASELDTGRNYSILLDIDHNKPILRENGGLYSDNDLDAFLGAFNDLNDTFNSGLISGELVYNNFSDALIDTYKNHEVQQYLAKIRIKNSEYFQGFDDITKYCINYKP